MDRLTNTAPLGYDYRCDNLLSYSYPSAEILIVLHKARMGQQSASQMKGLTAATPLPLAANGHGALNHEDDFFDAELSLCKR